MNEYTPKGAFIYLHCNFGWGGRCDGYYRDGIFDLRAPGDGFNLSDDTDESIGDIYVPTDRIYTNIRIVYNNKN